MTVERLQEIPTSIAVGSENVSFLEVHGMFRATQYGDILLDRSRWGSFKPSWMSDEQFEELIGVDVNNLKHIQLTFATARVFLAYCDNPDSVWKGSVPDDAQFTDDEKAVLLLCAITHDWGEASVGDTAQPNKTKKSELKEFKELLRIANETTLSTHGAFGTLFRYTEPLLRHSPSKFYHAFYDKLSNIVGGDSELFGKIYESTNVTLLHSDTRLAKAFNAIEKVGYQRSGLIGWRESANWKKVDKDMYNRLRGMAFSVHTHNLIDLVKYADVYPPVLTQLVANADLISSVYSTRSKVVANNLYKYQASDPKDTPEMIQQKKAVLEQKFITQRNEWRAFRRTHKTQIKQWKKEHPGQESFLRNRAIHDRTV